jgi:Family of unknown function (DUF6384)
MNDATTVVKEQAPLDELMLAMDVVDTLRHKELVLARELTADEREAELMTRLREIYTGQGIVVTDEILAQGVRALHEERFVYRGTEASFSRSLALLYVTRARWGKWVGGLTVAIAVVAVSFQLFVRGPELAAIRDLPVDLEGAYQGVVISTQDPGALGDARGFVAAGEAAIAAGDYDEARTHVAELRVLANQLQQQYEVRIVSRPGERSGITRVPDVNTAVENFYLIVEAITPNGAALTLPIVSEEDGRTRRVAKWGLRVDEATYERVRADKSDDGVLGNSVVGTKRRGELKPQYTVTTTGAAITEW